MGQHFIVVMLHPIPSVDDVSHLQFPAIQDEVERPLIGFVTLVIPNLNFLE